MSSKFSNDVANNMESILNNDKFQRIFSKTASKKVVVEEEVDSNFEAFSAFSSDLDLMVLAAKKKKSEDKEEDEKSDKEEKSDKKKDKKETDEDEKPSKKSKKDSDKESDEDKKDDKKKDKKKSFPFFKKKKAGAESEKCECGKDECDCGDKMYANALKHIVESFTVTSDVLDNMGLEKSAIATMAILNHIIEEAANVKFAKKSKDDDKDGEDDDKAEEDELKEKIEDLKEKFKKMHDEDEEDYDDKAAEALDEKITKLEDKLKDLKKKDLKTDKNDVRGTDLLLGFEDADAREGFRDPEMDDPKSSAVLEDIFTKNPKLVDEISPKLKNQFSDNEVEEQLRSRIKSSLPEIVHAPENTNIDDIINAHVDARANIPKAPKLPGDALKDDGLKTKIDELSAIDDNMDDDKLVKIMLSKLQKNFKDYEDYGDINCTKLAEDTADQFDLYETHGEEFKIPDYVFDAAVEAAEAYDALKENTDELNLSNDIVMACTLINKWVKNAHEFEDDSDNGINVEDVKSIIDILGPYSNDEIDQIERSYKRPKDLTEFSNDFYDAVSKSDMQSADDEDFGLKKLQTEYPEAYEALPEPYKNDSALVFFIDKNGNLCAEGDFGTNELMEFTWLTDTNEWIAIK